MTYIIFNTLFSNNPLHKSSFEVIGESKYDWIYEKIRFISTLQQTVIFYNTFQNHSGYYPIFILMFFGLSSVTLLF